MFALWFYLLRMACQGLHICLLCGLLGMIDAVYMHLFERHINRAPPMQCFCGIIRATERGMLRHQAKTGCHGPFRADIPGVPIVKHLRKATQSESKSYKTQKKRNADIDLDTLDYNDWMLVAEDSKLFSEVATQTDQSPEISQQLEKLTKENENLLREIAELRRINDSLATEILEPDMGIPSESALSGFEAAWQQSQAEMASLPTLFPDPPTRIESEVHVPATNQHLSRNQKLWKRSVEDAKTSYNKRHKR